jgi:hypothetical protein
MWTESTSRGVIKVKIEQNTISRDWTILYKGRRFFVNLTESDGQTLMLCNRSNWEISEETEDGIEELHGYVFKDSTAAERQQAQENVRLIEKLIAFCIDNWDNEFMHEVQDDLWGQKGHLEGQKQLQDNDEGGQ